MRLDLYRMRITASHAAQTRNHRDSRPLRRRHEVGGHSRRGASRGQARLAQLLRRGARRLPHRTGRAGAALAVRVLGRQAGDHRRPARAHRCAECGVPQRRRRQCLRLLRHAPADGRASDLAARARGAGDGRAAQGDRPAALDRLRAGLRDGVPDRRRRLARPLPEGLAHHLDLRRVRLGGGRGQAARPRRRADGVGAGHGGDAVRRPVRMPRLAGQERQRRQRRAQRPVVGAAGGEGLRRPARAARRRAGLPRGDGRAGELGRR